MAFCRRHVARCALLVASLLLSAAPAFALDVNVSNYSWLQLPAADAIPILGSANSVVGNGHGEPNDFRWGDYVWLPSHAMTATGTQMYYAGIQLDQSRPIDTVRLQWYASGANLTQYFIDGSNDGSSWTNIAVQNPSSDPAINSITDVAVTPGSYQYVRVRFEGPDYTSGGYGGPGFTLIEPFGDGPVATDKVNWANAANFGTVVTNSGLASYPGTTLNDGTLHDRFGPNWTGSIGSWPGGAYTQIDLGADRLISTATAVWVQGYTGSGFDVSYSVDGSTFFAVDNPQAPTQYGNLSYSNGASRVTFDPAIARYIRLSNAVQYSGGYTLMNQVLLHSPTEGVLDSNPGDGGVLTVGGFDANEVVTYTDAILLENTGGLGSALAIFDFSISGPDAARFDLPDFQQTILAAGEQVLFDLELNTLLDGTYNATLTFMTSLGEISFDLNASIVPEPGTWSLMGLSVAALAWQTRRRRGSQK